MRPECGHTRKMSVVKISLLDDTVWMDAGMECAHTYTHAKITPWLIVVPLLDYLALYKMDFIQTEGQPPLSTFIVMFLMNISPKQWTTLERFQYFCLLLSCHHAIFSSINKNFMAPPRQVFMVESAKKKKMTRSSHFHSPAPSNQSTSSDDDLDKLTTQIQPIINKK